MATAEPPDGQLGPPPATAPPAGAIAGNSADPVGYFGLPIEDSFTMGSHIEI